MSMFRKWWSKLRSKEPECVCHAKAKNLCNAAAGTRLRVEYLRGEEKVCQRLREMGFCESSVVEKMADSGALICKVCDAKIILSKELAEKIIVKDICSCGEHEMHENHNKIIFLSQMSIGQQGVVDDFAFETDDCERIEEMGLTPGETIEVVRYAPLGDPIEIKVRGYSLSLRKQEADRIKVKISS
jgi:ferrous iron transport protein A